MLLIHGLDEYGGRYHSSFSHYYTEAGIVVFAPDLPGHGKSEGARGHVSDPVLFLDLIDQMLQIIRDQYPHKPVFIYGHSLGGEIVLWHNLARKPKVAGIITTSPAISVKDPGPAIKLFLAKMMDRFMPSFSMDNDIDVNLLSHDKEVVQAYISDPLVHNKVSARLGMVLLGQGDWILKHAPENINETLVMVGTDEGIVSKDAIQHYCEIAPHTTLKKWPDLYHELHNEPEKEAVFDYTMKWIDLQTKTK
jgi:alpha-beta hydrolase superfamily lysophospholipase